MGIIKKPKNSLKYLKNVPDIAICPHCYEAKDYFKYKSKLKEHLSGSSSCKNSIVRKGDKPSKEFEVNHMVKTKSEAKQHFLHLTPNSTFSNVTGMTSARKCKQHGCNAMLRMRKSDRVCSINGKEPQIVSGYVIIGSLEHNHDDNVPLYAYCPYEKHDHKILEKHFKTLTAAKKEIKKLYKKYKEENRMKKRDQTIHYHCMDHPNCASWLRIVKKKRGYLVRGCVRHSKKSNSGFKLKLQSSSKETPNKPSNEPLIEEVNEPSSAPLVEDINDEINGQLSSPLVEDIREPIIASSIEPLDNNEQVNVPSNTPLVSGIIESSNEPLVEDNSEQINEPSNFSLVGELGTLVGLSEVSYSCSTCDFKVKTLEEMADHSMTFGHF